MTYKQVFTKIAEQPVAAKQNLPASFDWKRVAEKAFRDKLKTVRAKGAAWMDRQVQSTADAAHAWAVNHLKEKEFTRPGLPNTEAALQAKSSNKTK